MGVLQRARSREGKRDFTHRGPLKRVLAGLLVSFSYKFSSPHYLASFTDFLIPFFFSHCLIPVFLAKYVHFYALFVLFVMMSCHWFSTFFSSIH